MKRLNGAFMSFMLILSIAWYGCIKKGVSPVSINEAVDVCALCSMHVKNNGYAAELITVQGKVYKFEDIRCLLQLLSQNPLLKNEAKFIQDMNTREWIRMENAFFIYDISVPTPMNFGIHAFKTIEAAKLFLAHHPNAKNISVDEIQLLKKQ